MSREWALCTGAARWPRAGTSRGTHEVIIAPVRLKPWVQCTPISLPRFSSLDQYMWHSSTNVRT